MMAGEKELLRRSLKEKRARFSGIKRAFADEKIFKSVVSLREFKENGVILSYVSAKGEADTRGIIGHALSLGKTVAVPRCENGEMGFYVISSLDDLSPGAFGIPEPRGGKWLEVCGGLCLVPGLSFDAFGNRLGYGGGYYDRFLCGFRGVSAGLCYANLLNGEPLPAEEHDVRVNMVVTEDAVIRCLKRESRRNALGGPL